VVDELRAQFPHAVAQQHRRQFHLQRIRQVPRLAQQFQRRILQPPAMLLRKHPHFSLSVYGNHIL
jgi:hypothetical protein